MTRGTTRVPGQVTIDDVIGTLSPEALACRDMSHAWRPYRAAKLRRGYSRVLLCERCRTERHETLNAWGDVESRSYRYPDRYVVGNGYGRLTSADRAAIRLADIKNTYGDELSVRRRRKEAS